MYRDINTLRVLLRNALDASHPHVRGLNMDAPKKSKKVQPVEAQAEQPVVLLNGSGAVADEARH